MTTTASSACPSRAAAPAPASAAHAAAPTLAAVHPRPSPPSSSPGCKQLIVRVVRTPGTSTIPRGCSWPAAPPVSRACARRVGRTVTLGEGSGAREPREAPRGTGRPATETLGSSRTEPPPHASSRTPPRASRYRGLYRARKVASTWSPGRRPRAWARSSGWLTSPRSPSPRASEPAPAPTPALPTPPPRGKRLRPFAPTRSTGAPCPA